MEIKYKNVDFSYDVGTPHEKVALKDINVTIKEGTITATIGKHGSGKTTFIQLLNGLLKPTSGMVQVGQFKLKQDFKKQDLISLRSQVGLVFQFPEEQFFHTTVEKEIGFAIDQFQYRTKEKEKRIIDAIHMVGLKESHLKQDPFTLSSGEKRKVAIASILVFNPEVIILDEPTVGLDQKSKQDLIKILKTLKRRFHKTILVVSHDVDFIHAFADHILVFHEGKIVLEGNKYDVFKQEEVLNQYGLSVPHVIQFANLVKKKKKIHIGYRDEINDLIKDIYRYVK